MKKYKVQIVFIFGMAMMLGGCAADIAANLLLRAAIAAKDQANKQQQTKTFPIAPVSTTDSVAQRFELVSATTVQEKLEIQNLQTADSVRLEEVRTSQKLREEYEQREQVALAAEQTRRAAEMIAEFNRVSLDAIKGNRNSEFELSEMYFSGKGTTVDAKAGVKWLLKAASQGQAEAQYSLGEKYRTGTYVPKNFARSEMWFRRAMLQGHKDTLGGYAALLGKKQELAAAAKILNDRDKTAEIATARKLDAEKEEAERKRKLENAVKLEGVRSFV